MSKQEKHAKKKKAAKKKADKIVDDAVKKVKAKAAPSKYDGERADGCSDEEFALGVRVRELREEGEAWWAIARALELEGHGTSATTGKKGAARARTVYKKAFGSFPRTFKTGRSPQEKNERVRELQKTKKAERRALAKAGKSVISPDMPDEEVAAMLKGRRIQWWVQSELVPDGMNMEACIHPHSPLYIIGEGEDRVIEFREQHRKAPVAYRMMPANTRTVRLSQIYSVR